MADRKTIAAVVDGLEKRDLTKVNAAVVRVLVESLEKNPRVILACKRAKISVGTFHNWYRRWPEFAALVDEAQASGVAQIEDRLFQKGMAGDTIALIFLMKKWKPERYEDTVTIQEPKKPQRFDPSRLSADEQAELERLSAKALIRDDPALPAPASADGAATGPAFAGSRFGDDAAGDAPPPS